MRRIKVTRNYVINVPDRVEEMIEILDNQADLPEGETYFSLYDIPDPGNNPFKITDIFVDFLVRNIDVGTFETSRPDDVGGMETTQRWEVQ